MTEYYAPFSRWALARLILSATAGELSDAARALVPTSQDSLAPPGAFVQRALDLIRDAETALQLAVIVERERGAPWDLIGSMVGGDQHSANQRFGPSERRWRDALRETWSPATRESEGQAAALDEWVAGAPARSEAGARPVTDGLPRAGITEEITMALAELRSLDDRRPLADATKSTERPAWVAQRRQLLERLAELFGRLAAAQPDNKAFAEAAANARGRLATPDA